MISLLLILNTWSFFADVARLLIWLIIISVLLCALIYMIKQIFSLIGFSTKKIGIWILTLLGLYTLVKKLSKYMDDKKKNKTTNSLTLSGSTRKRNRKTKKDDDYIIEEDDVELNV